MGGSGREIPLKAKYRKPKPRGRFRADYNGNTGVSRRKGMLAPMVPGARRKKLARRYF